MADKLTFESQQLPKRKRYQNKENLLAEQVYKKRNGLEKCLKQYQINCQTSEIKKKYLLALEDKSKTKSNYRGEQNRKQFSKIEVPQKKLQDAFTQTGMSIHSHKLSNQPTAKSEEIGSQYISPFDLKSKEGSQSCSNKRQNKSTIEIRYCFGQNQTKSNSYQMANALAEYSLFHDKIQSRVQQIGFLNSKISQLIDGNNKNPFCKTQIIKNSKSVWAENKDSNKYSKQKQAQQVITNLSYTQQLKRNLTSENIYTNINQSWQKFAKPQKKVQRENYQLKKQCSMNRSESLNNLGSKINRITQRIRKSEQNKRTLQIDYKPFSFEKQKSLKSLKKECEYPQFKKFKETQAIVNQCKFSVPQRQLNYIKKDPVVQVNFKKNKQKNNSIQKNINQINQALHKREFSFYQGTSQLEDKSISSAQYKHSEDTTYKYFPEEKDQLDKLIFAIKRQIKLDEQLRASKAWFAVCKIDFGNKIQYLQLIINKKHKSVYPNLFKRPYSQIFDTHIQEQNPFFTYRKTYQDKDAFLSKLAQMVENYIASQTNWIANIENQMNSDKLIRQGFSKRMLDIQNRGKVGLEDLVRFVNTHTGIFYRNRDLYLIYRRVLRYVKGIDVQKQFQDSYRGGGAEKNCLLFEELLDCLCQKNC